MIPQTTLYSLLIRINHHSIPNECITYADSDAIYQDLNIYCVRCTVYNLA